MGPDTGSGAGDLSARLTESVAAIQRQLADAHAAREMALPACRRSIQAAGRSIRAVHRLDPVRARALADECEAALREAQAALAGFPAVAHAGFLHDAEKEYVEARLVAWLVARPVEGSGAPVNLPDAADLAVSGPAWLKGLAEAASELRRHLLDRIRAGDLETGERLLARMDDCYDALVVVDLPDALTGGLRRTLDALRAVLERTRGDVTLTVLQARLSRSLAAPPPSPESASP